MADTFKLLVKVQERTLQQYVVESESGETLDDFKDRIEEMIGDFPAPHADAILIDVEVVRIIPYTD